MSSEFVTLNLVFSSTDFFFLHKATNFADIQPQSSSNRLFLNIHINF